MRLTVSNKSDKPIYEQIYEQISAQILNGELKADFCLPSIRVVAKELSISVITVKKAWEQLEWNGFIYTRAGKGCFVTGHPDKSLTRKRITLAETKLKEQLPYYKALGLSTDELVELIKRLYQA